MCNRHESKFRAMARTPGLPVAHGLQSSRLRLRGQTAWATLRGLCALLVLAPLTLEVAGCNNWFRPVEWSELGSRSKPKERTFRVVPEQNRNVASLTPDDIVRVMQRVGFADDQILDLGTALHNALRFSGAATIVYGKDPVTLFAVDRGYLYIRSRGGEFNYDIANGRFIALPVRGQ